MGDETLKTDNSSEPATNGAVRYCIKASAFEWSNGRPVRTFTFTANNCNLATNLGKATRLPNNFCISTGSSFYADCVSHCTSTNPAFWSQPFIFLANQSDVRWNFCASTACTSAATGERPATASTV